MNFPTPKQVKYCTKTRNLKSEKLGTTIVRRILL